MDLAPRATTTHQGFGGEVEHSFTIIIGECER